MLEHQHLELLGHRLWIREPGPLSRFLELRPGVNLWERIRSGDYPPNIEHLELFAAHDFHFRAQVFSSALGNRLAHLAPAFLALILSFDHSFASEAISASSPSVHFGFRPFVPLPRSAKIPWLVHSSNNLSLISLLKQNMS